MLLASALIIFFYLILFSIKYSYGNIAHSCGNHLPSGETYANNDKTYNDKKRNNPILFSFENKTHKIFHLFPRTEKPYRISPQFIFYLFVIYTSSYVIEFNIRTYSLKKIVIIVKKVF